MKKHEFRKGDKVICVDNYGVEEYLENRNEYKVEKYYGKMIFLKGLHDIEFFPHRFELIQKQEFKIGDIVRCLSNGYTYAKRNGIYTVSGFEFDQVKEKMFIILKEVDLKNCLYECDDFELCDKAIIEYL